MGTLKGNTHIGTEEQLGCHSDEGHALKQYLQALKHKTDQVLGQTLWGCWKMLGSSDHGIHCRQFYEA